MDSARGQERSPPATNDQERSKSPAFAEVMNACQSGGITASTASSGCLESRTSLWPAISRVLTSTQPPPLVPL